MIWLYTEDARPVKDGPFLSVQAAAASPLWEYEGVCLWVEQRTKQGWGYEHFVWTGRDWLVTSGREYPMEPFRPECLLLARSMQAA